MRGGILGRERGGMRRRIIERGGEVRGGILGTGIGRIRLRILDRGRGRMRTGIQKKAEGYGTD